MRNSVGTVLLIPFILSACNFSSTEPEKKEEIASYRLSFATESGSAVVSFNIPEITCLEERSDSLSSEDNYYGNENCIFQHFVGDDTYVVRYPGGQDELRIVTQDEFLKMQESFTKVTDGIEQSHLCLLGYRFVSDTMFDAISCVDTYSYEDREVGSVRGLTGIKTNCFYRLPSGRYFAYIIDSRPLDTTEDACGLLSTFRWDTTKEADSRLNPGP